MDFSPQKMMIQSESIQIANMCMAMGIQKCVYEGENKYLTHMPVSLYPYQLSQQTYLNLRKAHTVWAKLILAVSKDKQLVNKVFQSAAKNDQFVRRFLELYNRHLQNQKFGVCCLRVDYMGDQSPEIVEYNLMSVGLNGISDFVQELAILKKNHRVNNSQVYYPTNKNMVTLLNSVESIIKIEKIQGIIVMLVHEKHQKQFNFGDQMSFQLQALKRGYIIKRVSMTQFYQQYRLGENNNLYLQNEKVAVVYFRTAYSPNQYISQNHWKIREDIQKSNVISIPSVSMQLINFKRMQVQLSKRQVLQRYLTSQEADLIQSLHGQIYDFQNQHQITKLIELARQNDYVLKPNRQGGGNNYFGQDVIKMLNELRQKQEQLKQYILMNKIKSRKDSNVFILNYKYKEMQQTTCQLSTFGSFSYKDNQMVFNQCGGNLVRIKSAEENEGGIAIDKAVIGGICIKKSDLKDHS